MSGTRKMEKFELDAFAKARAGELADEKGPSTSDPRAEAPDDAAAGADLPAMPFEPRPESGGRGPADLPGLPFEPRSAASAGTSAAAPATAVERPGTPGAAWVPGEWIPPQEAEAQSPAKGERSATPDPEALRTRLARKFVTLADSFTEAFRDFAIGAGAYAIELTAPGMSTGGGKQALQHIRLRPRREGYSIVVAGTVNQLERRAELRDFDHIAVVNEVRFRQPVDINRQEWEQFLRKAEVVLNDAGIQSMRTPPTRELLDQRRSMQRVSKKGIAVLLVVLALAAVVAWRVLAALRADG